jgi:hypothetical protein
MHQAFSIFLGRGEAVWCVVLRIALIICQYSLSSDTDNQKFISFKKNGAMHCVYLMPLRIGAPGLQTVFLRKNAPTAKGAER